MASGQNRQLLIMRHAKSDWDANDGSDFDRPLSKRGIKDINAMAIWLVNNHLLPDKIVSSPARRAKQTTSLLMKDAKLDDHLRIWDDKIYEAGLGDLLTVIDSYSDDVRRLLIVGHNPGLDSLVMYLARNDPEFTSSGKLMTTAAIAVMDYGDGIISAEDGSAVLIDLMRPKDVS
jgi:phosphohistidine phosphatase